MGSHTGRTMRVLGAGGVHEQRTPPTPPTLADGTDGGG